ncbi:hypothetical protein, partial [Mesorhizobium sp. M7D.F.Ca.US.004.03.1.1]|uniref:hypothetical protein n=1 Tax=Mesorhizobium sp. M7D.F.Ca.US.004.03.1.1 TaxID=2496702 RepID=UPI0019D1F4F4
YKTPQQRTNEPRRSCADNLPPRIPRGSRLAGFARRAEDSLMNAMRAARRGRCQLSKDGDLK